ncbi:hypothetical protein V500_01498 [Pseudogymnoascus sp. VKM F-4518 (FW-2643)]|nr:hypothetical protein V500_01498 [Pseudogymnoascus sp. VKM F-4518 (FW-2643)]
MSRTARTRGLPIQEPEDNALGPRSSSSITVSAPPFKRPRGRLRKKPLQSEKPRTALAYKTIDLAIVSTSKPIIATPLSSSLRTSRLAALANRTASDNVVHKLGKKRKRTLLEEVRPTDLQTECCNCSRKGKPPPLQPAYTDNTQADVMMLNRQAKDSANKIAPSVLSLSLNIVTKELYMPCIIDYYGDYLNFSKITVIQAQNDYKEARGRLSNVLSKRETCRERFYKLKSEIEWFGYKLEEHRRHFHLDNFKENFLEDSDSSSESTIEDSVADLATDTRGYETTQLANANISLNGIAKGIERPAEEANQ